MQRLSNTIDLRAKYTPDAMASKGLKWRIQHIKAPRTLLPKRVSKRSFYGEEIENYVANNHIKIFKPNLHIYLNQDQRRNHE